MAFEDWIEQTLPWGQVASPVRAGRINNYAWLIVALTGVALMCGLTFVASPPSMMDPDSPSYLSWSAIRTPGYPAFLSVVRIFDPELGNLPYFQMALLVAAGAFLAQAAARLGGPWWIWLLMGAGILGNPFIWRYAWKIVTDSLFITLVMVFLGCIAMALRRRPAGLSWLFAASVILGAAILVRPVGYALLGVAPLIGLVWHGRRWAAVGAATLPAIAMLLAVSSWNLVNKGYFATQLFDGYYIGKYDYTLPAISPVDLSMDVTTSSPVAVAKQNNAWAWSKVVAIIRQHPTDYIYHVLTNFAALWTLPDVSSAEVAFKIPGFAVPLKDGLLFFFMALSFLLVIAVAIRPAASPLLVFTAVAALCVNANHLLVALVMPALPRYAMAMWPGLLAMIAAFAAWVLRRDGCDASPIDRQLPRARVG
ncbi:MAG: hypothetical protein WCB50_03805 [Pseudolabrys sp.]